MTCTLCWQCTIQFRLFRLKLSFRTLYDFDSNETIDIYYFMYCRFEFLYFIINDCELFDRLQKIWYRSTHSCMCKYLDWWLFWSKNLDVTGSEEQFSKSGGGGGSIHQFWSVEVAGELVVGLWTLKMVYRVSTRYLLIQLQPINHFFNKFNKRERS